MTAPAFDWNQARAFLATAEAGSLSAAAAQLGLTQPTLSRQVAALEQGLGVTLFARTGRRLTLTQSGLDLLEHVRGMGAAAERFSLAASGQAQMIEGLVRLTVSDITATHILPPLIAKLRARHPGIEIDLIAANEVQDLRRREADIAIRNVRPTQNDLITRQLVEVPGHLYAAPALIAERGLPETPQDIAALPFIGWDDPRPMIDIMQGFGVTLGRDSFPVSTTTGLAYWELGRAGLGVVAMLRAFANRAGAEMVPLLPEVISIPVPHWLTTHAELHTSRRIRLVYDFLAEELPPILRG